MSLTFSRRMKARLAHRRRLRTKLPVPMVNNATTAARPQESLAMSCHRSQVGEYNAFCRDKQISGAHYKPDGTCVLESRQARNKLLRARGLRDNDAGYGDHAGE